MLALTFGRIGCFLNGCCFGKPTDLPWAVRFPYNSFAYLSQINPNIERNRTEPQLELPQDDYISFIDKDGHWHPKPYEYLTDEQKNDVTKGKYRCLAIHPTQLYSSAMGALLCVILFLFWRRSERGAKLLANPGCTFSLMFILYGIMRFFMEFLRDDNPFEFDDLTISQNISIVMIITGSVLLIVFQKYKPKSKPKSKKS